jgi:hypothetical protein
MGTIEIVGYVGDGFIMCKVCAFDAYQEECQDPINFAGSYKEWLKSKGLHVVTDQDDFGSEGCYCDCGNAIQESYCPKCGNATGTYGEICENCRIDDEVK